VNYSIPFGLIASILLPAPDARVAERAKVNLHSGEVLQLELDGDLDDQNGGILIFAGEGRKPEYIGWAEIKQIHFERPPAMYPPFEGR
jgi:hypothetical protein